MKMERIRLSHQERLRLKALAFEIFWARLSRKIPDLRYRRASDNRAELQASQPRHRSGHARLRKRSTPVPCGVRCQRGKNRLHRSISKTKVAPMSTTLRLSTYHFRRSIGSDRSDLAQATEGSWLSFNESLLKVAIWVSSRVAIVFILNVHEHGRYLGLR
jgi:hypothetical protein